MNKLPCRAHPEDTCENDMQKEGIQDEPASLPRTPHPFSEATCDFGMPQEGN